MVDDERALVKIVASILGETYDVATETSGHAALERIASGEPFDAIVCDLMMVDVSGMDLYEAVAAAHPGFEHRFVFMTGGAYSSRVQQFAARVKNPFLEKPFDAEELKRVVNEIIEREAKRS